MREKKHKRKIKSENEVKSHAEYNKNRLFHTIEQKTDGVIQTTNVTVTVNPEREGCWDGIKACFGFGAKVARSGS